VPRLHRLAGVDFVGRSSAVRAVRPVAVVEHHEIRADRGELDATRHKPVVREDCLFLQVRNTRSMRHIQQ